MQLSRQAYQEGGRQMGIKMQLASRSGALKRVPLCVVGIMLIGATTGLAGCGVDGGVKMYHGWRFENVPPRAELASKSVLEASFR
ncbi:MAG: hypothetical protein C4521_11620, partial [Actinobacteria bacterium]